eukprot:10957939-Alexandrium_andersonii.AAC.1
MMRSGSPISALNSAHPGSALPPQSLARRGARLMVGLAMSPWRLRSPVLNGICPPAALLKETT